MSIKLDFESSTLNSNMNKMATKLGAVVLMYSSTVAQQAEFSMKSNRPWTDRTGMAKARLSAKVSQPSSNLIRITLAHGVWYGIFLELAHNGNWAIIRPTIDQYSSKLIEGLNGIINKILS